MNPRISLLFHHLAGTRFIVPVIIAFVSLATLAVSANIWLNVSRNPENAKQSPSPGNASQQRFPIVLTNLTRFGFEPSAMRIPAGRCLLSVRNISGREPVELQVKHDNNGQTQTLVAEQHRTGKRQWEKFMEFGVGEYLITEAGNPQWTLRLTVIPPDKQ